MRVSPYAATTAVSPAAGRLGVDRRHAAGRVGEPGHLDLAHLAAVEHPAQPVDVVGVEVGEHQQRHPVDAEPAQAAVDRARVGPGVDDDGRARPGAQHQRVALADVAGREHPAARRPARASAAGPR